MRKLVICTLFLLLTLGWTSVYASDFGSIDTYYEQVKPNDENGIININITGKTNSEGEFVIPMHKDSEIGEVESVKGTLVSKEANKIEMGDMKYYTLQFENKESEVELHVLVNQEDTYKTKDSKQKGTFPGKIKTVKYKFVNTAPVAISNYALEVHVPEGFELYNIIGFDPEEPFEVAAVDNSKYGKFTFGEVNAGEETEFAINIYKQAGAVKIIIWIIAIGMSIFFLIKKKDVLIEAREISALRKSS